MEQGKITLLKVAVCVIGVVILSLCVFALPSLAKDSAEMNPELAYLQYPVLIGLYLTAIPFFYALSQALKLLSYIEKNNAFSEVAVNSLGIIKYCASTISFLYVLGMIILGTQDALHPGIAILGLVIVLTSIVSMVFTAVLQQLLNNVLNLKSENDLTI
ncbi:DUF2975 domain-containing protein [Mesobacillus subterraneus]|uniref:DUF2975 domain-containing protein n=1 Tax=Mesobacillus subterraneus TaxID=285983 RepID=A0A427TYE1_9BACI|nr:DUF2975 domain-containing protein [Mesobacillus subterraneus]RSD29567.1 DUF2975 domain-containing protein [Mesobacillus subterraneus]